ncbi:hypothetical protein GGF31_005587 [Allomyces arbusculus]|nr:hypothetical protein GGF31_005587 [Allomyces arbusculus]
MPPADAPPRGHATAPATAGSPVRYADVVQLLLDLSRNHSPSAAQDLSTSNGPRTPSAFLAVSSPGAGSAMHLGPSRSHLSLLSADPSDYADYLVAGDTPMTLSLADLLADSSVAALLSDKVRKADSVLLLREHNLAADQPASANPRIIVSFFHEDDGHDFMLPDAELEGNTKRARDPDPARNVRFDMNANILLDDPGLELSLIDLTSQPAVAAMTKPGITAYLLRNHPLLAAQANRTAADQPASEQVDRDAPKSPRLGMLIRILGNDRDALAAVPADYPRELVFRSDNSEDDEDDEDEDEDMDDEEDTGLLPDYLNSPGNSYNASTSDTSTPADPPSPRSTDLDTPPHPLDQSSDTAPDPSLRSSITSVQHNPDNSPVAHSMASLPPAASRLRPTMLAAPANTPVHSMLLHPHGGVYLTPTHGPVHPAPTHGHAFGPSPSLVAFPVPVNSPTESIAASQYFLVANPPPANTPAGSVYHLAGHGAPWSAAHAPPATHAYLAVGPQGPVRYASTATPLNTPMPSMTRLDTGTGGAWAMLGGGYPIPAHGLSTVLLAPHATPMTSAMNLASDEIPTGGTVPANTPMPSTANLAQVSSPFYAHRLSSAHLAAAAGGVPFNTPIPSTANLSASPFYGHVPSTSHLAASGGPFNTPMPSMAHLAATPVHARNVPQNTPAGSTADLRTRSPRGTATRVAPGGLRAPSPTPLPSCAVLAETQEEEEEEEAKVCAPVNTPAPSVAHLATAGSATTAAHAPHNTPMPSMMHLAAGQPTARGDGSLYAASLSLQFLDAQSGAAVVPHNTPMPSMAHLAAAATTVPANTPMPSTYQLATAVPANTPAPPKTHLVPNAARHVPNNTATPPTPALASATRTRPAAAGSGPGTAQPVATTASTANGVLPAQTASDPAALPGHVYWFPAPTASAVPQAAPPHVIFPPHGTTWTPTGLAPAPVQPAPQQQQPTVASVVHDLTTHLHAIPTASAASLAIQLETGRRMHELHVAALQAAADRDAYRHVLERTVEALRGMEVAAPAAPVGAAPGGVYGATGHEATSGPWIWAVQVPQHEVVASGVNATGPAPAAVMPLASATAQATAAGMTPGSSPTTPTGPAPASAPAPVPVAATSGTSAAATTTTTVVNGIKVTRRTAAGAAGASVKSSRSAKPAAPAPTDLAAAGGAAARAAGAGLRP